MFWSEPVPPVIKIGGAGLNFEWEATSEKVSFIHTPVAIINTDSGISNRMVGVDGVLVRGSCGKFNWGVYILLG